jgi:hypothetical protein
MWVDTGGELTIAAGTIVESEALTDDQIGGMAPSRIEIIVDGGTFVAEGTELQPIRFTSSGVPQRRAMVRRHRGAFLFSVAHFLTMGAMG